MTTLEIIRAVRWSEDGRGVRIVDQRLLPERLLERDLRTAEELCAAIQTLAVRGAPAIGIAGAMGLAIAAETLTELPRAHFDRELASIARRIRGTRPTAVNLPWAIDRLLARATEIAGDARAVSAALRAEAEAIHAEDAAMCGRIGDHGLALLPEGARVLTHCNAGALATGGIGTALAPIYRAAAAGRRVSVWADETRPLLQGSRLTAWELSRAGIPVTVIADNMAGALMGRGLVDLVIVGADRIAANGDVANKIGSYALAVLAHHHGIPFYVAAPTSTFDAATATGDAIEIEDRDAEEIRRGHGRLTAPEEVPVHNPAFDITPAALITAIVSDRGVHHPPYDFSRPQALTAPAAPLAR